MGFIDKYNMISLAPSLLVIAGSLVMVVVGIRFVKSSIARDAKNASE